MTHLLNCFTLLRNLIKFTPAVFELLWTKFVSNKYLNFDCDPDLGRGSLNFVRHTPSYVVLSSCKV